MNAKEAKDFLAEQAAQQAALEGVPFSDLERRMMYFSERDPASCPNPIELSDEFDQKYETAEYEAKVWLLLHHAYDRLKKEKVSATIETWQHAIGTLRAGDHYLLVLWNTRPRGERPKGDSLKLFGSALAIVASVMTVTLVGAKYHLNLGGAATYGIVVLAVVIIFWRDVRKFFRSLFGQP